MRVGGSAPWVADAAKARQWRVARYSNAQSRGKPPQMRSFVACQFMQTARAHCEQSKDCQDDVDISTGQTLCSHLRLEASQTVPNGLLTWTSETVLSMSPTRSEDKRGTIQQLR